MARSALRALPIAAPVLLVGSLAVVVPAAEHRAAALCAVPVAAREGDVRLDAAQVSNARIIIAVGVQQQLPRRAAVVAIAAAMQQSRLRNHAPDAGRAGIFHQHPSNTWGTRDQLRNPVHTATTFYRELVKVPAWQELAVGTAAYAVQRSARPKDYERWQSFATSLVSRLSGGALTDTCHLAEPVVETAAATNLPREQMGADGLTARTRRVAVTIARGFGVTEIGGFCPGGCTSGHVAGSDHYTGNAIDVMLLPLGDKQRRVGDRIATWLVANADALAVKYVIWQDQIWSIDRARQGWRSYAHPSGARSPTLRHLDHVHVSIR